MKYPRLFEPIRIRNMEVKNRLVMPAMHLNYTPNGEVTDRLVEFYRRRAEGGVGLIIVGGCIIDAWAGGPHMIGIEKDARIPGLKGLVDACRGYGARLGAQLYMAGAYSHSALIGRQAISASTHVSRFTREEARAMTREEIRQVIRDYGAAARRAEEAGFELVEILAGAGYLISQFLSPVTNTRDDEYGGTLENRMRFGIEVVREVRECVGPDMVVGVRLAGHDFVPGSHTNEEHARFARALEEAGADLFNVTGGWHETRVPQITYDLPPGGFAHLARGIRDAVGIPVAVSNRINRPDLAESLLADFVADLVCVARGLLADPDFPKKAREGRDDEIRRCVACNQRCFDHVFQMKPIGCLVNPAAGREFEIRVKPCSHRKKVLVIGGGPAGCEAALTAVRRGHEVTLLERSGSLGGQVVWWAEPTAKYDFRSLAEYYSRRLPAEGVDVRLNTPFPAAEVDPGRFDRILVATGARPMVPEIPGVDRPDVVQAWDVLRDRVHPGRRVLVVGGGAVGLETAVHVAKKGTLTPEQLYFLMLHDAESPERLKELLTRGTRQVRVVEMLPKLGHDLGPSTRWIALKKLRLFHIQAATNHRLVEITDKGAVCRAGDGDELRTFEADTVVLAVGSVPENEAAQLLMRDYPDRTVVLGDAEQPRTVADAVEEGFRTALEL